MKEGPTTRTGDPEDFFPFYPEMMSLSEEGTKSKAPSPPSFFSLRRRYLRLVNLNAPF